jgi:hypothetical protein
MNSDVLERIMYAVNTLLVAQIGTIESVNDNGTVDISINELGKFNSDTWFKNRGFLTQVPVAKFKFGAFSVDTPVSVGDNAVVLFCDGNVLTQQFKQRDDRRHTANNAIAIIGLEDVNSGKPFDKFYAIRHNDKPIIKITEDGSEVVIDAKLTVTQDTQLQSKLETVGAVDFKNTMNVVGSSTMTQVSASTVGASTIGASGSLTVQGLNVGQHVHEYTDDGIVNTTSAPKQG